MPSAEQAMTDSNNNAQAAPSGAIDGQSAAPAAGTTPQIETPAAGDIPVPTAKIEAVETAKPHQKAKPEPKAAEPSRADAAPAAARSTALILAHPDMRAERPSPEPAKAAAAPSGIRFRTLAASIAVAALLGGGAGALANYGMARFTPPKPERPVNTALNQAVSRIDREIAQLKTGMDSSAKAMSQQIAKIADRVDRAEKAQAEANARLAKTSDVLDRVERRLAATAPTPAAAPTPPQPEVTGSVGETHVATANPPSAEARRSPSSMPTIEGWFVRDAMNGAALIQGRGVPIEVLPGDVIPGLGRIEQIKRQDGRWVVVTSRGLIVPR